MKITIHIIKHNIQKVRSKPKLLFEFKEILSSLRWTNSIKYLGSLRLYTFCGFFKKLHFEACLPITHHLLNIFSVDNMWKSSVSQKFFSNTKAKTIEEARKCRWNRSKNILQPYFLNLVLWFINILVSSILDKTIF